MPTRIQRNYFNRETAQVGQFVDHLKESAVQDGGTLDSVSAHDAITSAITHASDLKLPPKLQTVLDEVKEEDGRMITRAIVDGINKYEREHGVQAPADVVEQALHLAWSCTDDARRMLDSATSLHHDQLALQPNRAVVAILSALGEAIPFAYYLPADIRSNKSILAILSHRTGNTYGRYAQGDIIDGSFSGNAYITSARLHTATPASSDGTVSGKLTTIQTEEAKCDQSAPGLKLLRGRTLVYIGGQIVAGEVNASGSGSSVVSGKATVEGTEYVIGGTIDTDTGDFTLTTSPKLADTVPVVVEGFIDYERATDLTPTIITAVDTFELYAKPWRVTTHQTIDSRTQLSSELGLDPYSESVVSIQAQFANERHYEVIAKALRLAQSNQSDFDINWSYRQHDLTRADIWRDFSYPLATVSQQMALDTMSHGVSHLYVTNRVAAQMLGMPSDVFQSSGIAPRPGIFRLGRLFGQYEVYYTPKGLAENEKSSQVLAIGRAHDVTRNPFVLGDAVPPTVVPLAINSDLRQGAGFYARNYTSVNPHGPSSKGAALINIINMK